MVQNRFVDDESFELLKHERLLFTPDKGNPFSGKVRDAIGLLAEVGNHLPYILHRSDDRFYVSDVFRRF